MNILNKAAKFFSLKSYSPSTHPTSKEERIFWQGMGPYGVREFQSVSAALRAGNVIASGMGSMPIQVDGNDDLVELLNTKPNPLQTGVEFIEQMTMHAVFTGVGRAFVERRGKRVVALYPMMPQWCSNGWQWDETAGEYQIEVTIPRYSAEESIGKFGRDSILEITSPRWEYTHSIDPIKAGANVLGLSRRVQDRQARLSASNAPAGILVAKEGTSQAAISKLKEAWVSQFGKTGVAVVDFEASFTQMMQTATDQQLLETAQFQVEEVARLLGVHPYFLFKTSGSGAQNAISDIMLFHQVYTIGPWIRRWEASLQRSVTGKFTPNFDESALLRTTPSAKAEIHARALGAGGNRPWMTQNQVAKEWGYPEHPDGDTLNPAPVEPPQIDVEPVSDAVKALSSQVSELKGMFGG